MVKFDDINIVVIQAGGLGSRMGHYTENRPKCLIPFYGKTILQHQLDFFKNKKIFIISDYKKDVLKTYIETVIRQDITIIEPTTKSTSSGLCQLMDLITENESFILTWSDLIYTKPIDFTIETPITVGLTNEIECRWSYNGDFLVNEKTKNNGVVGFFIFENKNLIKDFNCTKSLVRYNLFNVDRNLISFKDISGILELGTKESYEELLKTESGCRNFNKITINNDVVIKECINDSYKTLIENEINWYEFLENKIDFIPTILNKAPLTMNKICGGRIFDITLSDSEKRDVIVNICENLSKLHQIETIKSNYSDLKYVYYNKTIERVNSIRKLVPYYDCANIRINDVICKNPMHPEHQIDFLKSIETLFVDNFYIIHGDPTLSNIILDKGNKPYFIDPRGIFGETKIFGDKNYDWAKLYYSVNGNYDSINCKKFNVKFEKSDIYLKIASNGFEEYSDLVIEASGLENNKMLLHQSLIWLSLTGYTTEDIEAILYAYYYGVYIWNLSLG